MDRLPEELREQHDRHMAQEAVFYRGFSITPLSHRFQPFYTNRFYYWGYNVCSIDGGNVSPGACWYHSIGHAKTAIDVMYEVGFITVTTYGHSYLKIKDSDEWWSLIHERDEEQRALQEERDGLMVKIAKLEGRFGLSAVAK